MKNDKCIVHGCANRKNEGVFVGDVCGPCHEYITTGQVGPTESFLGEINKARRIIKKLEKEIEGLEIYIGSMRYNKPQYRPGEMGN